MKQDKLLEQAIYEAESFLQECKTYQNRIIENYKNFGLNDIGYDDAPIERATLKARSLLLIRKLQAWRKAGRVK